MNKDKNNKEEANNILIKLSIKKGNDNKRIYLFHREPWSSLWLLDALIETVKVHPNRYILNINKVAINKNWQSLNLLIIIILRKKIMYVAKDEMNPTIYQLQFFNICI